MNSLKNYLNRITVRNPGVSETTAKQSPLDASEEAPARSHKYVDRVSDFEKCLRGPEISLFICRSLCFGGIPDSKGMRSLCWKILLGYLPTKKNLWPEVLEKRRREYEKHASSILINPFELKQNGNAVQTSLREVAIDPLPETNGADANKKVIDNPLLHPETTAPQTTWAKYFDNNLLRDEIAKDVQRTHSGMHFFKQKVGEFDSVSKASFLNAPAFLHNIKMPSETHHDVMGRILFLFAKLNPGVRYVQGMNELLAPIYYVFAQDPDDSFRAFAEADAFFCFTRIMAELKDRFIASLDSSELGISSCIEEFRDLLRKADPELYLHLEKHLVDARWLTLLCSQEFRLPDVLRLWDSLFSNPVRFEFLRYCCCSMLMCIRSQLLSMGYADMLQMLQSYPEIDVTNILNNAENLVQLLTGRHLIFIDTNVNTS